MAFLFCDSFDHYVTADRLKKWTTDINNAVAISAGNGRNGSASMRPNGTNSEIGVTLTTTGDTCIIGFAFKSSVVGAAHTIARILDTGTVQINLQLNTDLTLSVLRSSTVLGTTTFALTSGVFAYIELKVLINATTGTVTLRVNGDTKLALTGQNTRNSANSTWNQVRLCTAAASSSTNDFDDLYILDGSGSAPHNDFYGDVRVDAHYPDANGNSSMSTPSTGTDRYATVDESAPNGDTDYNTLAAVNDKDTLGVQNLIPSGATIVATQVLIAAEKTDAGAGSLCPVIRHSGVDYDGAGVGLAQGAYAYVRQPYPTNPGTSAAWTETNFNAVEVGYKRTA